MTRIQRQRTKGWRMPPDAVYVGRPSRWGNPFRYIGWGPGPVESYRRWLMSGDPDVVERKFLAPLRGKTLACWCPLDQPCHADVLLELLG